MPTRNGEANGNMNDERARRVEVVGDENHTGTGLGRHAHVPEPDLSVAGVIWRRECPKLPVRLRGWGVSQPISPLRTAV